MQVQKVFVLIAGIFVLLMNSIVLVNGCPTGLAADKYGKCTVSVPCPYRWVKGPDGTCTGAIRFGGGK